MALEILLVMMVLDYTTGIMKAIHNKKLNSIIGAKGIVKKVRIFSHSCGSDNAR